MFSSSRSQGACQPRGCDAIKDWSKLDAELQELEAKKRQLDASDVEIDNWDQQISKSTDDIYRVMTRDEGGFRDHPPLSHTHTHTHTQTHTSPGCPAQHYTA